MYPSWGEAADILMAVAIIASAYIQWRNGRRVAAIGETLEVVHEKIEVVHLATNSMHDEVVKLTHAEGVVEGRAAQVADDKKDP